MDKEKATRTLARELMKANGQNFIVNPAHQKHLLEKAISYYQIEDEKPFSFKIRIGTLEDNATKISTKALDEFTTSYKKGLTEDCSRVSDSNYVFTENSQSLSIIGSSYTYSRLSLMNTLSFFALIGEKEINNLRELFYKDVHQDLVYAMNKLNIKNFVDFYRFYSKTNCDFFAGLECLRFIDFVSKLRYDGDGEIHSDKIQEDFGNGIDSLNAMFEKIGVETHIDIKEDRKTKPEENPGYIHKTNLLKVVDQVKNKVKYVAYEEDILNDFYDFVFSLPYEDQNIESNKEILRKSENLEFVIDIVCQEYSQGKYFQEYFDVLDDGMKERVVHALKSAPHKPAHDPFLWGKGFREVDLDYLDLYKENGEGFIEYFSSKTLEERKVILKDIMDCDFINEDVADWLNKNEPKLVKEVGLNG